RCFCFFQAEDGIRDKLVTGVQTCALPISQGLRSSVRRCRLPGRNDRHRDVGREGWQGPRPGPHEGAWRARHKQRGSDGGMKKTEIGRASCRERVERSEGAGTGEKKKERIK